MKLELFAEIRDAILGIGPDDDFYYKSPVFEHFSERHIQKLDYNEKDRSKVGATAHEGKFMRPERILATRKPILGQIYRLQTAASANSISAGAVTEALANDLTRLAGIPTQELTISRGQYSDGHPKLMLEAKFAKGYKDMEAGFLKDGRIVPLPGSYPGQKPESLGKYKAFFLLTADRDGVGKRGQNKGFVGGKLATRSKATASTSTSPTTSRSRIPTARAPSRASTTSPSSTTIRALPSSQGSSNCARSRSRARSTSFSRTTAPRSTRTRRASPTRRRPCASRSTPRSIRRRRSSISSSTACSRSAMRSFGFTTTSPIAASPFRRGPSTRYRTSKCSPRPQPG